MQIAGVDEAGRGALAGPVVAAAVVFTDKTDTTLFSDSKVLSEKKRDELFDVIMETCIVGVSSLDAGIVDKYNIFRATMMAMSNSVEDLGSKPDKVLVDGNKTPDVGGIPVEAIVKGDQKIPEISAASIIAKVTRDRAMMAYHVTYSQYGFDIHKGYGTKAHYDAVFEHGPCDLHRRSFNLNRQETLF
jgi:ribonuclease HII